MSKATKSLRRLRLWPSAIAVAALAIAGVMVAIPVASEAGASPVAHGAAPITIGAVFTESGPAAPFYSGEPEYFSASVSYINAHGGVQGHKLVLHSLDDGGQAGQNLLDFEQLWSQDHALVIYDGSAVIPPFAYIRQNSIPTLGSGGEQAFASADPSVLVTASQLAWIPLDIAYYLTHVLKEHPKAVALLYEQGYQEDNQLIENYWHKLGTGLVDLIPDGGPTADCTATILKIKAEGVQFFDMEALESNHCILAMHELNWFPKYSAGGANTSLIGSAELLGKDYSGILGGNYFTTYQGLPLSDHPTAVDKTYVGTIKKYAPQYADYAFLNSVLPQGGYNTGEFLLYLLNGTLTKYHKLTSPDILKYGYSIKNWTTGMGAVVESFAPNCKTGADGTVWGTWKYNANPTAARPTEYLAYNSGPNFIGYKDTDMSLCFSTQQANRDFPNG